MFPLVPAHPGFPGQIPQSRKTVVCVCVCVCMVFFGANLCPEAIKQVLLLCAVINYFMLIINCLCLLSCTSVVVY